VTTLNFLLDGPDKAEQTVLLAHGAGAPMDSVALAAAAAALAGEGFRVARFEFSYMASRRTDAGRKPPPRAEKLEPEYLAAVEAIGPSRSLIIGGKSMGGRVASMVADQLYATGRIGGLLCLGYPFHPPGKPDQTRTRHLTDLKTPTLIAQGTRDVFGTREEVGSYALSPGVEMVWLEDGDHDLKPRKASGFSASDHMAKMAAAVRLWSNAIAP